MLIFKIAVIVCILMMQHCRTSALARSFRGTKLICPPANKDYVEGLTCSIRLVNRTTQLYNIEGFIKPNVSVNWFHVKITSYFKFSVTYRKTLINLDEDICGMLDGTVPSKMLSNQSLVENRKVLEGCPYKSGLHYIRGIQFKKNGLLHDILPTGNWRLDLQFYTRNNSKDIDVFKLMFYFEVKYVADE